MRKNTQKEGQNGHFYTFSDPWLAWATKLLHGKVTSSLGRAQLTWASKVASE